MKQTFYLIAFTFSFLTGYALAQNAPTMGWSSWNAYHVNISDSLIMGQADALVENGLKAVGYTYVNIDDGFFGGRDAVTGRLKIHPTRFPKGLKPVVEHIHSIGLKAGIYSDGGRNTCGNYYDKDTIAVGVGLYGHDDEDARFFFNECGFDFIKIDFCGGVDSKNSERLQLDERERYTAIRRAIDATGRRDVRINICRWDYPGTWVGEVGDSWRMSHDIRPRWSSVKDIIGQNLCLSAYASAGHYNDMDMLEVGRGMSQEEDRTHFGLWCIMSSPLLIGCDLNSIKPATLALLKNEELIALNQDPLGLQAYVARNDRGVFLLVKDLKEKYSAERAVAVYNSTDETRDFDLRFNDVELGGEVEVRDLFEHKDIGTTRGSMPVKVPAHGTRIFRLKAAERKERTLYEAETAYLSKYQELMNNQTAPSAIYENVDGASGGVAVTFLGKEAANDLVWRNVFSKNGGKYTCTINILGDFACPFIVEVNGKAAKTVRTAKDLSFKLKLPKGENTIRLYTTENEWMPAIDCMTVISFSFTRKLPVFFLCHSKFSS